jgi:hypothetical protein
MSYNGKRALKWLLIALVMYTLSVLVREVAWTQMIAGGAYVLAFLLLLLLSAFGTVALGISILFAMIAVR